jgi:predicted small metal-binding protein
MDVCSYPDCSWRPVAPSADAARRQYAAHVVDAHARTVETDIPEGMVQVKLQADGEWLTVTPEEARRLHRKRHGE